MADDGAHRVPSSPPTEEGAGVFLGSGTTQDELLASLAAAAAATAVEHQQPPPRRRSSSFSQSALHVAAQGVDDDDNELFMSDEFRMYCYKVSEERRKMLCCQKNESA